MNTTKRRIVGSLLVVLGIAIGPALALANVSLLTMSSTYFVDTGVSRTSVHPHWPTHFPCAHIPCRSVVDRGAETPNSRLTKSLQRTPGLRCGSD